MYKKKIKSALISVFYKDGLDEIIRELDRLKVKIYSTGGTQSFIESLGVPCEAVEDLTTYPSILDGRVKTLHPKVFGGILARREESHTAQLEKFDIPEIDLVIVDLYPFEETVSKTTNAEDIIEKIDIGGISLIRAAAKNFQDVVVVPSRDDYAFFLQLLKEKNGYTKLDERRHFAMKAFNVSSHYDTAIFKWFVSQQQEASQMPDFISEGTLKPQELTENSFFKHSIQKNEPLRYGENPHQSAVFFGDLTELFETLNGKALSYNNLVDVDAAVRLMREFKNDKPTFAILKHTNACGVATKNTILEAWTAALASDPISAFGGILICNTSVDVATANEINKLFYEVLIAPDFAPEALTILRGKKQRILLKIKDFYQSGKVFKSLLNGVIQQDADMRTETAKDLKFVTSKRPTEQEIEDLLYANICVKHLKSNGIAIVKNRQLITMGCGQTSRIDALQHALEKAAHFGFDVRGAVMASEAFFPFPDCVEIADKAGITAVIQPGGSVKDQDSIDYCNAHGVAMVMTGVRHFLH
ncbi:MAG: bifunctional phosphoribosylaminoimidazolecarboxamide formyltransferase/IMP cyclohydrolase [Saprospiraceae bacterium]|nr:bifunctional phosphoribosylaminoimidazolecarboxamide formyltransferase/IMP cyclohydrolase [Saprospiraceae bacterium]